MQICITGGGHSMLCPGDHPSEAKSSTSPAEVHASPTWVPLLSYRNRANKHPILDRYLLLTRNLKFTLKVNIL